MRGFMIVAMTLCALPARAQPVSVVQFDGVAHLGALTRAVAIRFSCARDRAAINNLAIELDLPDAEKLQAAFDANQFEGPSGKGAKAQVVVVAGAAKAQFEFTSTGSYGNNGAPETTFTFSAAFTPGPGARDRANLQKLQAVVGVLGDRAGHLNWRIDNPGKGPALEVAADVTDVDAAKIKAAMVGCKGQ